MHGQSRAISIFAAKTSRLLSFPLPFLPGHDTQQKRSLSRCKHSHSFAEPCLFTAVTPSMGVSAPTSSSASTAKMCLAACCRRQPRASSPYLHGRSRALSFLLLWHSWNRADDNSSRPRGPTPWCLAAVSRRQRQFFLPTLLGFPFPQLSFNELIQFAQMARFPGHEKVTARKRRPPPVASPPQGLE